MSPDVLSLINASHGTSDLITEEASDVFALELLVGIKLGASLTVPGSIRNIVSKISTVTSLMNSDIAKFANNNFISVLALKLQANIALDIIFIIVLWNLNGVVWVLLLLFLFLQSELLPGGYLWLLSSELQTTFYDMRLHHDVSLNIVVHFLILILWRASLSAAHWVEHGVSSCGWVESRFSVANGVLVAQLHDIQFHILVEKFHLSGRLGSHAWLWRNVSLG